MLPLKTSHWLFLIPLGEKTLLQHVNTYEDSVRCQVNHPGRGTALFQKVEGPEGPSLESDGKYFQGVVEWPQAASHQPSLPLLNIQVSCSKNIHLLEVEES